MKGGFESNREGNIEPGEDLRQEHLGEISPAKTSERLMRAIELHLNIQLGKITINGKENLEKLPKDKKVVVVPTHISDMDIPLTVYAVGNALDVTISNQSVHHDWKNEPSMKAAMLAAGEDNFLPIDFIGRGTDKRPGTFNPDNFVPMMEAMDQEKAMIVPGHNPSLAGHLEEGGYGQFIWPRWPMQ
jgi:hypothetical protein